MDGQHATTLSSNGNGAVSHDIHELGLAPERHGFACPGRAQAANPLAVGLTVASTGELLAGGSAGRRATTAAGLLLAARRPSWRMPALSAALAGASLDLGSTRARRAAALVRLGVLATLLRETRRIDAWERV